MTARTPALMDRPNRMMTPARAPGDDRRWSPAAQGRCDHQADSGRIVAMTDQLSPMEAIMWRVGQDATLRMTVGALMILERPPSVTALAERLVLRSRQRAAAAPATRRSDRDAHPAGLGRRSRSGARAPPPIALGRRSRLAAAGARPRRTARVDPVRSRALAVGRDADRGPRGRASGVVPAGPPRAHRRRRRDPAARAAPRRARVATGRRPRLPRYARRPTPRQPPTATASPARSRSRSTCPGRVRRFVGRRATRRATSIPSTRRCVGSNGPSTSPTRSPAS